MLGNNVLRQCCTVLKCLSDAAKNISNIFNSIRENEDAIHLFCEKDTGDISRLFATHYQYTITQKHKHFLLYLIDSIHLLRKPHIFQII